MHRILHQISGFLTLIVLLAACGTKAELAPSHIGSTANAGDATVEVFYWDNKNLGFGHVATAIHGLGTEHRDYYVSYAMGNNYEVDREKHGKDPERLRLPERSAEQMATFEQWYAASPYSNVYSADYGADYKFLTHNCAHAILDVLRALSYELPINGAAPFALRPVQVFHAAQKLAATSGRG